MRQHVLKVCMIGGSVFETRVHPFPVMVVELYAKSTGPLGYRLPNAPHAVDAQPLARELHSGKLCRCPSGPATCADEIDALGRPARGPDHEKEGQFSDSVGENSRGIDHRDAARGGSIEIDVIVAYRVGRDDSGLFGQSLNRRAIERVGNGDHQRVMSPCAIDQVHGTQYGVCLVEVDRAAGDVRGSSTVAG